MKGDTSVLLGVKGLRNSCSKWISLARLCYLSALLLGVGLTLVMVLPPLIAVTWFPKNERASAQAVMFGTEQLGLLVSYLEPLLVEVPSAHVSSSTVQKQVATLMYISAACGLVLCLALVAYFPSGPPSQPSYAAGTVRMSLSEGAISFLRCELVDSNCTIFYVHSC